MVKHAVLSLALFALTACGHGRSVNPPQASEIDMVAAILHNGEFQICSGSRPVQWFRSSTVGNLWSGWNWTSTAPGITVNIDRYEARANGIYWVSSDGEVDGQLTGSQRPNHVLNMTAPLTLKAGAPPLVIIDEGPYTWQPCPNGVCNVPPSFDSYYTDTNTWTFDGRIVTRHEVYNDPQKPPIYDAVSTFDLDGLRSFLGFNRCN